MKKYAVLLILISTSTALQASININTRDVQKSVIFIYGENSVGQADERNPIGTGFLVAFPTKADPTKYLLVMITARHIVDPSWAYCGKPNPQRLFIRLNKTGYDPGSGGTGVAYLAVSLVESDRKNYLISDDDRVDAAIVPLDVNKLLQSQYDYIPLDISVFANSDELKALDIGDQIISAGLIPNKSGERRNYPFFKFGNISSKPGEGTWISCERGMPELRLERVWFIAANLVEGNSGSPIFYLPFGGNGSSFGGRAALIGIQSSSFLGADIAGMTPIEDVYKIIEKNFPTFKLDRGVQ